MTMHLDSLIASLECRLEEGGLPHAQSSGITRVIQIARDFQMKRAALEDAKAEVRQLRAEAKQLQHDLDAELVELDRDPTEPRQHHLFG